MQPAVGDRSADPKALGAWYAKHLGVQIGDYGATFCWKDEVPKGTGMTAWNPFPMDTTYFGEGNQATMINYRVDDLDALLVDLAAGGVWIDPKRQRELWSLRLDQGLRREQGGALAAARDARDVAWLHASLALVRWTASPPRARPGRKRRRRAPRPPRGV